MSKARPAPVPATGRQAQSLAPLLAAGMGGWSSLKGPRGLLLEVEVRGSSSPGPYWGTAATERAIHSAQIILNFKKVLMSSLPEIVSGKKVPGFQFLSFITSDPQRLINLELFHSGVFPKQLG